MIKSLSMFRFKHNLPSIPRNLAAECDKAIQSDTFSHIEDPVNKFVSELCGKVQINMQKYRSMRGTLEDQNIIGGQKVIKYRNGRIRTKEVYNVSCHLALEDRLVTREITNGGTPIEEIYWNSDGTLKSVNQDDLNTKTRINITYGCNNNPRSMRIVHNCVPILDAKYTGLGGVQVKTTYNPATNLHTTRTYYEDMYGHSHFKNVVVSEVCSLGWLGNQRKISYSLREALREIITNPPEKIVADAMK